GYVYFKTKDELMDAYGKLVRQQVLPLIQKGLCGVIYTQLSDVEIETNGILTYDREVLKFNPSTTRKLHEELYERFDMVNRQPVQEKNGNPV
ncbi:MAG: hypothetical protein R3232_11125, partial [Clostridia bacterium]|nr:hypothetical protein [Clostridia bacterium]